MSLLDRKSVPLIEGDILKVVENVFQLDSQGLALLNERQKIISQRILDKLKHLLVLLGAGETEEVLSEEFSLLNRELDELNLSVDNEAVFDHLFSQFCIGK